MAQEGMDFSVKIKELIKKISNPKNKQNIIIVLGAIGILLIFLSSIKSPAKCEKSPCTSQKLSAEQKREQLEHNLKCIISKIHGAGSPNVMITLESAYETVYATEEKKNDEASEDKSDGETMRKKQCSDCEKKFITVKDSEGSEKALAVTEIEPKIKGVVVTCPGGDDPVVKNRITDSVITALNIASTKVYVTRSG